MSTFKVKNDDYKISEGNSYLRSIKSPAFKSFNPSVLGLGDVSQASERVPAIAAFLDLEGFTKFSNQSDPELSIPKFLSAFLDWIFTSVREEAQNEVKDEIVTLWHDLPFLAKFMGDGILFLWKTESMSHIAQHNLILTQWQLCRKYETEFLIKMKGRVTEVPHRLRCGIAKGSVYSVGNGEDYVGPCINMAARLQKMPGLTFAFNKRGFEPEDSWTKDNLRNWILRSVAIRGIGESELIYIHKDEFRKLTKEDKSIYHSV